MGELSKRIKIQAGSDAIIIFRMKNKLNKDPLDLTDMSKAKYTFEDRDGNEVYFTSDERPAGSAFGEYQGVEFSAVTGGSAGNAIKLEFDGTKTIQQVLTAWNSANPGNTVQAESGATLTSVLDDGELELQDGFDAYTPVEVFGNPILGKIKVTLKPLDTLGLKVGINQSIHARLDFGLDGPRRTAKYENLLDVIGD